MSSIKGLYHIFDRLEDHIRGALSHHPFIYAFVGGTGFVLFWRGVWHTADILERSGGWNAVIFSSLGSIVLGISIMLATGLFVSMFIGDSIIMSGIKKDKKVIDKTIEELEVEKTGVEKTLKLITEMKEEMESLEKEAHHKR